MIKKYRPAPSVLASLVTISTVTVGLFLIGCATSPTLTAYRFSKEERIGLDHVNWSVVYDGGGQVQFHQNGISLQPRPPRKMPENEPETLAALVVSRFVPRKPEFRLRVRYRVDRQLRDSSVASNGAPRPWEVFWLFWGYREGLVAPLKETNYFLLKPNGIEIGRAFEKTEQAFLATADTPKLRLQTTHELVLVRLANRVLVEVDGKSVLNFSNQPWPLALYEANGKIGLYVEDASAVVQGLWISYPREATSAL